MRLCSGMLDDTKHPQTKQGAPTSHLPQNQCSSGEKDNIQMTGLQIFAKQSFKINETETVFFLIVCFSQF